MDRLEATQPAVADSRLEFSDVTHQIQSGTMDNMWVLGGEIICDLNQTRSVRKVSVDKLLADLVKDGGPLLYHSESEEQRSFESTCRKFQRFLTQSAR